MPSIAIPCLRYRDTPAAIDWLCEVFGFACQLAVPGTGGAIVHAPAEGGACATIRLPYKMMEEA